MSEYIILSDEAKLDALFGAVEKIDSILDDLRSSVYDFMPLSSDFNEQHELDNIFWHSNGMDGILQLDDALRKTKDIALNTVHKIGRTTHAQVAY